MMKLIARILRRAYPGGGARCDECGRSVLEVCTISTRSGVFCSNPCADRADESRMRRVRR